MRLFSFWKHLCYCDFPCLFCNLSLRISIFLSFLPPVLSLSAITCHRITEDLYYHLAIQEHHLHLQIRYSSFSSPWAIVLLSDLEVQRWPINFYLFSVAWLKSKSPFTNSSSHSYHNLNRSSTLNIPINIRILLPINRNLISSILYPLFYIISSIFTILYYLFSILYFIFSILYSLIIHFIFSKYSLLPYLSSPRNLIISLSFILI